MEMVHLTSRAPACGSPRARAGAQGSLRDPWACPKMIKSVPTVGKYKCEYVMEIIQKIVPETVVYLKIA